MQEFFNYLLITLYLGFISWPVVVLVIWSLLWKIAALWKSARNGQKVWFVALLLAPTLGLLEIIYFIFNSTFSKRMKILLFALLLVVVFVLLSIWGSKQQPVVDPPLSGTPYELQGTPLPKGDRILGIDVNMAEDNDYDKSFQLAKSLGSEVTSLSMNWKDIETAPGKYEDPGGNLAVANVYYPQKSRLALYIRAVDTASKMAPADLETVPFTAKEMAERYLNMIDWVFAQIPDVELLFLSVGDEIDLMMGDNKQQYQDFGVFLKTVREEIKKKHPNLLVGFTATLQGLTEKVPEDLKALNQYSDAVFVSYYPKVENGGMNEPSVVAGDYESLVKRYPGRIIYFEQTGYPTSPFLKSSEAKQREFVRETFRAWDTHASQIKYISFAWLTDLPQASLDAYKEYYKTSDKTLLEFLRTLGFRTNHGSGQDKEAFRAIQAEAKARGW